MSIARDYANIVAWQMYKVGYRHITFYRSRMGYDLTAVDIRVNKVAVVCRYNNEREVNKAAVREAIEVRDGENCRYGIVASHSGYTKEAKELAKENKIILWDI